MWILCLVALLLLPQVSQAQRRGPLDRPGDTRPELPDFEPEILAPSPLLPRLKLPEDTTTHGLTAGRRILVTQFSVEGNTAISDADLEAITDPFKNTWVSYADLEFIRDQLTQVYQDRGYLTSGAVIPDQTVSDGVIELQIVEGTLAEIGVHTDGRFREAYVRDRISRAARGPLNVRDLEAQLQLLQLDDRIRSVTARLRPGERRGDSFLEIELTEDNPLHLSLVADNHRSPSVGSQGGHLEIGHLNLTGNGDRFFARYERTQGVRELEARFEIPINSLDTKLELDVRTSRGEVVIDPFDDLGIETRAATYAATLRHPLYRTLSASFELFLTAEHRRSKSFLLDQGFSFLQGPEAGLSRLTILRFGQDWTLRGRSQVFAVRSTLSWGIDAMRATTHGGDTPDGKFLAWLFQGQWARRLPIADAQVIVRSDLQLAESPLLSLEQFTVGGYPSVRGYHENELIRDNGAVGSVEVRIPLLKRIDRTPILELAPFFDIGHSWNTSRGTIGPKTLASIGLGLRWRPAGQTLLELYWGHALRDVPDSPESDLQDHGVHLRASLRF